MKQLKQNQVVHSSVEVLRVQKLSELNNPVVMAKGIHLFPSRTQQLSPYTSKVLGWKRPGRIDSCRLKKRLTSLDVSLFFSLIQLSIRAGFLRKFSNWQISKRTLRFLANEWLEQWTQGFENLYCSASQIVPRRVLIVPHEIRVKKSQ